MSTLALKKKIRGKVEKIEDKQLWELIYRFVAHPENNSKQHKLTVGQIAGIKSGLADLKAGRLTKNEDFEKELDEWLAKVTITHPILNKKMDALELRFRNKDKEKLNIYLPYYFEQKNEVAFMDSYERTGTLDLF